MIIQIPQIKGLHKGMRTKLEAIFPEIPAEFSENGQPITPIVLSNYGARVNRIYVPEGAELEIHDSILCCFKPLDAAKIEWVKDRRIQGVLCYHQPVANKQKFLNHSLYITHQPPTHEHTY